MLAAVQGTPQVPTQRAIQLSGYGQQHPQARQSALTLTQIPQQQMLQTGMSTPAPPAASGPQILSIGGFNPNIQPDMSGFTQSLLESGYNYPQILDMITNMQRSATLPGTLPASISVQSGLSQLASVAAPPAQTAQLPMHPVQRFLTQPLPPPVAQPTGSALPQQIATLQQQAPTGVTASASNTSLGGLSSIIQKYNAGAPPFASAPPPAAPTAPIAPPASAIAIVKPAYTVAQATNKAKISTVDLLDPEDWNDVAGPILFMPIGKLSVAAVQYLRKREGLPEDLTLRQLLDTAATDRISAATPIPLPDPHSEFKHESWLHIEQQVELGLNTATERRD